MSRTSRAAQLAVFLRGSVQRTRDSAEGRAPPSSAISESSSATWCTVNPETKQLLLRATRVLGERPVRGHRQAVHHARLRGRLRIGCRPDPGASRSQMGPSSYRAGQPSNPPGARRNPPTGPRLFLLAFGAGWLGIRRSNCDLVGRVPEEARMDSCFRCWTPCADPVVLDRVGGARSARADRFGPAFGMTGPYRARGRFCADRGRVGGYPPWGERSPRGRVAPAAQTGARLSTPFGRAHVRPRAGRRARSGEVS